MEALQARLYNSSSSWTLPSLGQRQMETHGTMLLDVVSAGFIGALVTLSIAISGFLYRFFRQLKPVQVRVVC